MTTNPYAWAAHLADRENSNLMQRESTSQQMLMNLFQEEANRQRPFVTMPARLAEAQFDRQNAEPFQARGEQRRYRLTKAGQEEATAGEETDGTNENGDEIVVIGGKSYVIPASKKPPA